MRIRRELDSVDHLSMFLSRPPNSGGISGSADTSYDRIFDQCLPFFLAGQQIMPGPVESFGDFAMSRSALRHLRFEPFVLGAHPVGQLVPSEMCHLERCSDLGEKVVCLGKPGLDVDGRRPRFQQ